jgi:hypothetical protein
VFTLIVVGAVGAALIALPLFNERSRRWDVARVAWIVLLLTMLLASFFVWFLGAVWLCGSDTTEPAFGEGTCDAMTAAGWGPLRPWLAISAIPLLIFILGGRKAFQRQSWLLFTASTLGPPMLLVVAVALMDAF